MPPLRQSDRITSAPVDHTMSTVRDSASYVAGASDAARLISGCIVVPSGIVHPIGHNLS
jgi:hypothetical protein